MKLRTSMLRLGDVRPASVELQPALADDIHGLHDQACLDLGAVGERP